MTLHNLYQYLGIFCLLVIVSSCGDRPSNVLSEDKMVSLMVDMELAEAYQNTTHTASGQERIDIGKRVLKMHGVSEETLDTTLAWYGRNIDEYSELFKKVDKEIIKRQKKYTEIPGQQIQVSDNLWQFGEHLIISPLSGQDAFSFSLNHPEIEKGDLLEISFALPNALALNGTLGVEYTDGSGDAVVSNFSSKKSILLSLQTDSSRSVSKIFGSMHFKDINANPVYIDSLKIIAEPIDTANYKTKRRNLKSFGIYSIEKPQEKTEEKKDSTDNITSNQTPSVKTDEPNRNQTPIKPQNGNGNDIDRLKNGIQPTANKGRFEKLEKN